MEAFEYMYVPLVLKASKLEEGMVQMISNLNELGAAGWEMVTGVEIFGVGWGGSINSQDPIVFLKRRIQ